MTYTAQERLDILKKTIETNAKPLTLNGVEYNFAPLTLGGVKQATELLTSDSSDNDLYQRWIKLAMLSLSRVMPDITEDELNIAIDSQNLPILRDFLLNLSGFTTDKKEEDPKEPVATETHQVIAPIQEEAQSQEQVITPEQPQTVEQIQPQIA
jgi:hypothetical protein